MTEEKKDDDMFSGCCDECFHSLAMVNAKAAAEWVDMCSLIVNYGSPHYPMLFEEKEVFENDNPISFLEKENFILSTESSKCMIVIKLIGYNENQKIFCLKKHEDIKSNLD